MTTTIRLSEYDASPWELPDGDATFISRELSRKISISQRVDDPRYWLNPNQYVGVVTLPSGARLESYPKVDVRNLFHILAVVLGMESPFREEIAKVGELDSILEFVAEHFADLVENRINAGLYRSYVDREDNLTRIRGRIDFLQDVRLNYVLRHRTYCRFSDLTWDVEENQVIRQVAHMLSGWGFRRVLRSRLGRIDAALAEVSSAHLPPSAIAKFNYNRLNEDYRPIHALCRLFLEGASLSEELGIFDFRTFLIDMNQLFEGFVTQILVSRELGAIRVEPQYAMTLDLDSKVHMKPDLRFTFSGKPAMVADCKYKKIEPDEYKHHDLYQLVAYCLATGTDVGLLLYPRHFADVFSEITVRNTSIRIAQVTIDLSKIGADLEQECNQFAERVFAEVRNAYRDRMVA